jgi:hypothetical protein
MPIHVIQSNHPKIVVHSPDPKAKATLDPKSARKIKAVRISYHRRLYGLAELVAQDHLYAQRLLGHGVRRALSPSARPFHDILTRSPSSHQADVKREIF